MSELDNFLRGIRAKTVSGKDELVYPDEYIPTTNEEKRAAAEQLAPEENPASTKVVPMGDTQVVTEKYPTKIPGVSFFVNMFKKKGEPLQKGQSGYTRR